MCFVRDGSTDFVHIWSTAAYPRSGKNFILYMIVTSRSRVKTEGQILNIATAKTERLRLNGLKLRLNGLADFV